MITPPQELARRQVSGWLICNLCAISNPAEIQYKSNRSPEQIGELSLFMQNEHWHFRLNLVKI
jgi:hypothetical protein